MIILDRHMLRPIRSIRPFEADPILNVDTDAVCIRPVAFQLLEVVPGKISDIAKIRGRFKPVESPFGLTTKGFKLLDARTRGKSSRACIAKAADHDEDDLDLWITSSVNTAYPRWSDNGTKQEQNQGISSFCRRPLDARLRGHDEREARARAWLKASPFPAKTPSCPHSSLNLVTSISAI